MVSNGSPEGLPAGWTVQLCALKTGRKVKYYVNLRTGQKVMSKDEALRYARRQNTQARQPQAGEIAIDGDSKNDQINLDRNTNEPPEWLPPGWIMELKSMLSGAKCGETYKCYVELSSGHRCYSKPEVFRYLKEHKIRPSKKKETLIDAQSEGKDLPPGWITEFKIRKRVNGSRRDPYYTDPVTGYIFRSKKDVLRYLENGEISKHAISPKKGHIREYASTSPKREKLEDPATRQQGFTDRLIDAAEQSSHAGNIALSESETPNEKKGAEVSTETVLSETTATEFHTENGMEVGMVDGFVGSDENSNASDSSMPKAKDAEKSQLKNAGADNGPISTAEAVTVQEKKFSESRMEKDKKVKSENSSRKPDGKGLNSHSRSSRRLAGLQPELVSTSLSSAQAAPTTLCLSEESLKGNWMDENCSSSWPVLAKAKTPWRNGGEKVDAEIKPVLSSQADIMQEQNSLEGGMKSSSITEGSLSKSTDKIRCKLPRRSSKRLAGLEPELVISAGLRLQAETTFFVPPSASFPPELHTNGSVIDYGAQSKENSYTGCLEKPKPSVSQTNLDTKACADNGPVLTVEADILQQQSIQDSGKKSSRKKTPCGSRNSHKKKGMDLPRRTSKRISGLEAELVANSLYSDQPCQSHKMPANKEASVAKGLSLDGCEGETSKHLKIEQTTILHHTTEGSDSFQEEPPSKSQNPTSDQANPVEQSQDLEFAKTIDRKPEPAAVPPNWELLSDPCIEFAFKTLIGEIPVVPPAADNGPIVTLSGDIPKLEGSNESGSKRSSKNRTSCGTRKASYKKGLNLPSRSSKRLAGHEPELVASSLSSIPPLQHGTGPDNKEAALTVALTLDGVKDEASKQPKAEHEISILHLITDPTDPFEGKQSNMSQPLHDQVVSGEHSQDVDMLKTNSVKLESPPAIVELLSDPCIEFAFKTLTGEIPIESAATEVLLVSTRACDILSEKTQLANNLESYNCKTSIDVRKSRKRKELNLPHRSSKRPAEAQPHQLAMSGSSECILHKVAENSRKTEAILDVSIAPDGVDEASQQLKVGTESDKCDGSAGVFPMLHMEPSNVSEEPHGGPTVIGGPSWKPEVENMKIDKLEKLPSFSFGEF